jgi:hypothetical protein
MDLSSPVTLVVAWLLAPGVVALMAAGLGAAVGRLSGQNLGALTLPAGYLAGIVLLCFALELGVPGTLAAALCAACAATGLLLLARPAGRPAGRAARRGARAALWPAGAGVAAYAAGLAPLAGSGRAGILGYVLNNDPALHVSAVELLRRHGAVAVDREASSFAFTGLLFDLGYPLGSHAWPMVASMLPRVDAFHVWTPLIALTLSMAALVAYAVLRALDAPRPLAAVAGTVVACGYLPFSYLAQGGAKEVSLAAALLATAALFGRACERGPAPRSLLPTALGAAAVLDIFGLGALAWLGPAALAGGAWLAWEGRRRVVRPAPLAGAVAGAALVAVLAAGPTLLDSVAFARTATTELSEPLEVGNLLGPVPWYEAFNVWLASDYRMPQPEFRTLTLPPLALAAVLALIGVLAGLRRRSVALPLAVVAGTGGALLLAPAYSVYIDAKTYVVLAPALGLASGAGLVWLGARGGAARIAALTVGGVLAAGVLASDALVYRGAWVTPEERFEELAFLGERYRGQGPILVNEREEYAPFFLRDVDPWASWGQMQPERGLRYGPVPVAVPHTPDFDDYTRDHMARFNLLLERKRPGGSAPPASFRPVFETPHYRVWQRTRSMASEHLALGADAPDGAAALDCARPEVDALLRAARSQRRPVLIAPPRRRPVRVPTYERERVVGFTMPGPVDGFQVQRGGFSILTPPLAPGRYAAYLQGAVGTGERLYIGTRIVGEAFGDLGLVDAWHELGSFDVERSRPRLLMVGLEKPFWQSGARPNTVGPLAFVPDGATAAPRRVAPADLSRLCGRRLDWVELTA